MIIRSAVFVKGALKPEDFPAPALPEIAFAGRSNVGKSSLINTILGRKSLVRTSRTPGQTQLLNFFLVNDRLMFVDLPGYGYSKAPKGVIRSYQQAMADYLQFRRNLALLVLLLDIRRSPSEEDRYFFDLAVYLGLGPVVVLTKTDTVSRGNWPAAQKEIGRQLNWGEVAAPVYFSAKTRLGKDELWRVLEEGIERKKNINP